MSKLYHVTVSADTDAPRQEDVLASSMDVAVKRALEKSYRTAKHLRIEANLSNHGEYDKVKWTLFETKDGKFQRCLYSGSLKRRDGQYQRVPQALARRTVRTSAESLARQFIDMTDSGVVDAVTCVHRGQVVAKVFRASCLTLEHEDVVDKQLRFVKMV